LLSLINARLDRIIENFKTSKEPLAATKAGGRLPFGIYKKY